jgi:P27 family predicted phage terminase small subunit
VAGRKPIPTTLKRLRGNPGRRPIPSGEPQPMADASYCPRWMDDTAKAEWRRVSGELREMGLLTVVDRAALEAYCQTYARWRQAEETIRTHGSTYLTDTGYVRERPEVGIAERYLKVMRAFMVEFGMTPSSRSRIHMPGQEPDADPFEEFLKEEFAGANG